MNVAPQQASSAGSAPRTRGGAKRSRATTSTSPPQHASSSGVGSSAAVVVGEREGLRARNQRRSYPYPSDEGVNYCCNSVFFVKSCVGDGCGYGGWFSPEGEFALTSPCVVEFCCIGFGLVCLLRAVSRCLFFFFFFWIFWIVGVLSQRCVILPACSAE